ncbi:Recombination endonuclease VII [compost metagenome]
MTVKFLREQGGLCPLCNKPIDLNILREGVVDHDHNTGEVRGVLHRGCNGAEGKVANSVGRWAGTGMQYDRIIPWLENLLAYLKREGTGWMYPTHQTAEEKAQKAKLKRRTATAQKQARIKVRSMKPKEA